MVRCLRFGILCFATVLLAVPASAKRYIDNVYGFSVEIGGRPYCGGTPHDLYPYGITLYLDGRKPADCTLRNRVYIRVAGNVSNENVDTAEKAAELGCDGTGTPVPPPTGLHIDHLPTAACRHDHSDGSADLVIVALVPDWRKELRREELPYVTYDVHLHTRPERFDSDLRQLRSVLSSIRVSASNLEAGSLAPPESTKRYYVHNTFGFSVAIGGRPFCRLGPYEGSEHGVTLIIDHGKQPNCFSRADRPHVKVYGDYVADDDPDGAAESAETACDSKQEKGHDHLETPPPDLHIDGRPTTACRTDYDGGWVAILISARTEKINYTVALVTKAERLAEDVRQLRTILASIRLFQPR